MTISEVAHRYAKALYMLSSEGRTQDTVQKELRALKDSFEKDASLGEFLQTPLFTAEQKTKMVEQSLSNQQISEISKSFLMLLAKKGRLALLGQVVDAFQIENDKAHGVTRGTVRSTTVLSPEEREQLEDIVAKSTGKRVILSYKEDPSLIGGLIAEVGSYTFDDTLSTHLNRLKEELKRRAH